MAARENIIPVFVPHLGCPNDCVFCNQRRITGRPEPATAETVRQTVESSLALLPEGSKPQLAFYGGSFTAIPVQMQTELLEAGFECVKNGRLSSIRLSTRPDAIDGEIIKRLKRYGVATVELGVQSLDDRVLELAGRGHTAQDAYNAFRLLKDAGFRVILQMMTGLPGDNGESSVATAKKIAALKPDGVRIYPTVIIRDTALFDLWQAGEYPEHTVENAVKVCAEIVPLFEAAEVPIIRLGLHPTDELSAGGAVGGAYHPALGELVKSRILLNRLRLLLADAVPGAVISIACPGKLVSQAVGQHRCNVETLVKELKLSSLKIVPADVADLEIM